MKWIYRLFTITMLGAVIIGPFFLDNQDGKPILSMPSWDDFKPDKLLPDSFTSDSEENDSTLLPASGTTVYKWKDKQGSWHYGDQPPIENESVSTLQINSNTNIIQSLKIEPEEETVSSLDKNTSKMTPMPSSDENFLSMERALNVLNDAKAVQGLMDSRNTQLNAITGEASKK